MRHKWPIRFLAVICFFLLCWGADYRLPARNVFPSDMPRYPNLWFYIEKPLVKDYPAAVKLVTEELRKDLGLEESSGGEGADLEARAGNLQPWQGHTHALLIRYYYSSLVRGNLQEAEVAGVRYYRLAASAHYLPGVENCPICGRTGWYAKERGSLLERVQDPLGLELATMGMIREKPVIRNDGKPMEGICNLLQTFMPTPAWMNTQRIGVVVLRKGWETEKRKCIEDID